MPRWLRQRTVAFCLAGGMASALAGCSVHPLPDDVSRVSTVDIVRNIRCEVKKGLAGFEGDRAAQDIIAATVIGFDFKFDIAESNTADDGLLKLERTPPLVGLHKLTVKANEDKPNADLHRSNVRTFQIIEDLADLKKAKCSGEPPAANPAYPITGAIGMDEVVRTFVRIDKLTAFRKGQFSAKEGFTAKEEEKFRKSIIFSDDIAFTTTVAVGAKPELKLNPGGRLRVTNASVLGSASRTDEHFVVVALGRAPSASLDTVAAAPGTRLAGGPATKVQFDARMRRKLYIAKTRGAQLIRTVRDPRVQAALIQAHADTRTAVLMELKRKRKLRDDEVEPASALGQRLLDVLKLP